MFGASLIGKGKAVALRNYGQNEAERALGPYLYDDDVQVMSSFEMNKFASLTYGTQVCIDLFNLMGDVLLSPADGTVLALQKTLALLRHVVVYGSEDAAMRARDMVPLVARLLNFNTVLHVDGGAGDSFLSRMRGGAVDHGAPVREEAAKTHELLRDPARVRVLRERHADPSSLVPIGDRSTVLFRSDKEAVRAERAAAANAGHVVRSNLAKESNGFGSGYNARGGERVVGAAHSVEEMIAAANMEQSRYVDDENDPKHLRRVEEMERVKKNLEDVRREEAERRDAERSRHTLSQHRQHHQQQQQQSVDLLDFGGQSSAAPVVAPSQQQKATTLDIFDTPVPNGNAGNITSNGSTGATHDLMGFTSVATTTNTTTTTTPGVNQDLLALSSLSTTTTTTSTATASADLMGLSSLPTTATNGSVVHDPFAPVSAATEPRPNETSTAPTTTNDHDDGPRFLLGAKTVLRSIMGGSSSSTAADESIPKKSFAELDRLAESNSNHHRDDNADASSSSFALDDLSRSLPSDAPSTALPSVEIHPPPSEAPPPPPPFEAPPPVPEMGVGFNSYDGAGEDGGLGGASLMGGAASPAGPRSLMGGLGDLGDGLGAGGALSTAPPLPTSPPPPVPPTPPPPVDAANNPMAMMQQQMMMMQASMTPEQQQRMLQQQMLMMQTMMMNMNQNGGGGSNAGSGPNGGGPSGFSGP